MDNNSDPDDPRNYDPNDPHDSGSSDPHDSGSGLDGTKQTVVQDYNGNFYIITRGDDGSILNVDGTFKINSWDTIKNMDPDKTIFDWNDYWYNGDFISKPYFERMLNNGSH
jgi:hypothetical protein